MRRSLLFALILALFGGAAWASEEEKSEDPLEVVATLTRKVADEDASWNQRWSAYKEAKPTLEAAANAWSGRNKRGEKKLTPREKDLASLWHKHLFDPDLKLEPDEEKAAEAAWLKRKMGGEEEPEREGEDSRTEQEREEDREAWAEKVALASAWDAYLSNREKIAARLSRDHLVLTGWIMGLIGALLLWGGFAWHVRLARKSQGARHPEPLEGDETWPLRPEEEAPP